MFVAHISKIEVLVIVNIKKFNTKKVLSTSSFAKGRLCLMNNVDFV
jgi:hypothetical protein